MEPESSLPYSQVPATSPYTTTTTNNNNNNNNTTITEPPFDFVHCMIY